MGRTRVCEAGERGRRDHNKKGTEGLKIRQPIKTSDSATIGTRTTSPDGRATTYQRDILGRITSVSTTVNGVATTIASARSYRPDGLLLGQTFGNGLNEVRQYDTQGRLTYQSLGSADTRLYSFDANGNLTGLQSLPLVGVYNYDALDRLKLDQRTTTGTTSSLFTFDANGNRLSENTGTYAYLAQSNRLTSTPSGSITLDAAGNTLSDGTRSYTYNNAGLVSAVAGAGYAYSHRHLRSRKVVGSQTTVFHYDLAGNLLSETDPNGAMRRVYVWADGQPLAQIDRVLKNNNPPPPSVPLAKLPAQATVEQLIYLHTDPLDTPRLATNTQAQTIWRWEGTAFGSTTPNEDPDGDGKLTTINLRFPGQYYDAESGLHYNWNRYYDPKIGRYVTSDPVGLRGGLNTYGYASNSPLRFTDPSGLTVCPPDSFILDDPRSPGAVICQPRNPDGPPGDRCVTAECAAGVLPNPPPVEMSPCEAKCSLLVGMLCKPVAAAAPGGWAKAGSYIACEIAVEYACRKGCEKKEQCDAKKKSD